MHGAPVADNTRVAVVYRDGVPNLYLNGKFAKSGLKSPRTPHPSSSAGGGFSGYVGPVFVTGRPFGDAEAASDAEGVALGKRAAPDAEPVPFVSEDGKIRAEFFKNGKIEADAFRGAEKEEIVRFCREVLQGQHFAYFIFGDRHLPIDYTLSPSSRYINTCLLYTSDAADD